MANVEPPFQTPTQNQDQNSQQSEQITQLDTPAALGAPASTADGSTPTRFDFAMAVLGELGAPATKENVRALVAWMERENTRAQNNPFATTKSGFGSTSVINSHNVRNYPTFEQGVSATVATLNIRSYYGAIVDLLRGGEATVRDISLAVGASPWGTGTFHHFQGNSALNPISSTTGTQFTNGAGGGDPYSALPDQGAAESPGQNFSTSDGSRVDGTLDRPDDLDNIISTTWPNGVPEDVQWADLPPALQEEVQRQLGYITTYIQHPELGPVLIRGALMGEDPALTEDRIRQTEWWRSLSDSARVWEDKVLSDPASAQQDRETRKATAQDLASSIGVSIADVRMSEIIEESLRFNWSEAQLVDALVGEAVYDENDPEPQGELGTISQRVQELAGTYGLQYGDQAAFDFAARVVSGEQSESDIRGLFIEQAKSRYPWFSERFDQGYDLRQLMDTRANEVARILGVDAQEVDFVNDPRFQQVLEFDPGDGNTRSMTMQETRQHVAQLPEFEFTSDSMNRASSFGRTLLQKFGAV